MRITLQVQRFAISCRFRVRLYFMHEARVFYLTQFVIRGSGTYIWVRAEIKENFEKWKHSLQIRRGELNGC